MSVNQCTHAECPRAVRTRRLILQNETPEDFVIATGITTTVREFCELAFDHLGMPIEWQGSGVEEVSPGRSQLCLPACMAFLPAGAPVHLPAAWSSSHGAPRSPTQPRTLRTR